MKWIDATNQNPPASGWPELYLVITASRATVRGRKGWCGMGRPELATYCAGWARDSLDGWNARGGLGVAFWMPLPAFDGVWVEGLGGEEGHWEVSDQAERIDAEGGTP